MPADPIYFDHHATTPCDPRVVEEMLPYFTEIFGNPASLTHMQGRRASSAVEDSRIAIARLLGVQPNEIYFTSGATESNNIALNLLQSGDHLVTTAIEHSSVVQPAKGLERKGVEVTLLGTDEGGFVDPNHLREALRPNTRLVSIGAANSEIGTVQPFEELAAVCREREILFHTDATQAVGKVPMSFANVDLASFSAHKFYGPKGIGGLYVRRGIRIQPLVLGGRQEKNVRSGTINVPGVVGMGAALRIAAAEMEEEGARLTALRDGLLEALLAEIDGVTLNGPRHSRLPGNLNVSFERVDSDSLIVAMRNFALSAGSACSSGTRGASPVLTAIGISEPAAFNAIRIGLGRGNTAEHTARFVQEAKRAVARLREISAA